MASGSIGSFYCAGSSSAAPSAAPFFFFFLFLLFLFLIFYPGSYSDDGCTSRIESLGFILFESFNILSVFYLSEEGFIICTGFSKAVTCKSSNDGGKSSMSFSESAASVTGS